MQYRSEIDGLRAVAVLSVVIYHAFPSLLPGGFIGVDIFFVISGYLITNILVAELDVGKFSVLNFYKRRVSRLFPALIVVLVSSLLFGWAVLLPHEFKQLGWHTFSGASFFANIALWLESGYFDTDSKMKILLHLWSLGVEEQFYFFWPLFLLLVKRNKKLFFCIAPMLIVCSFYFCLLRLRSDPSGAFYLPHYRFWELMMGGLLAYGESALKLNSGYMARVKKPAVQFFYANFLALLGVVLVASGLLLVDAKKDFPGWWAILPVAGSLSLIMSGGHSFISRTVLSNKLMVWVGLISYPLYLWHWPVFTFARLVDSNGTGYRGKIVLVCFSFVMAFLTYKFVEKPLRRAKRHYFGFPVSLVLVAVMLIIVVFSLSIFLQKIPGRLHDITAPLSEAVEDQWGLSNGFKEIEGNGTNTILFFGDSFMMQLWPRVESFIQHNEGKHSKILFAAYGGCKPIPGVGAVGRPCEAFTSKGFEWAARGDVRSIVITASWLSLFWVKDYYDSFDVNRRKFDFYNPDDLSLVLLRLNEAIGAWKKQDKQIYLILTPPKAKIANPSFYDGRLDAKPELGIRRIPVTDFREEVGAMNMKLTEIAEQNDINIIDPQGLFCDSSYCYFTDQEGVPYFRDATHLRGSFVREHYFFLDNVLSGKR